MTKTELAAQYVQKYIDLANKFKTSYSKREIAKNMFDENQDIFKDIEDSRRAIRSVTGANGNLNSKKFDLSSEFAMIEQPIKELNFEPFIIPKQYKRALIMSDIHGRFHDRQALEIAVNYGLKHHCDCVILNGDIMDFYQLSRFDKNPSVLQHFWTEREWMQDFLLLLQKTFGKVYYKTGNHELRRELYLQRQTGNSPEIMGLVDMADYVFFDNSTVEVIQDYNIIKYGKLNIIHGHEYQGGGGIHVAYNRLNKSFDNVLSAHSHVTQSNLKKDISGNFFGSWTIGCLCDLNPRYNPMNNWNHGFATVEKEEDGSFEVWNKQIINGKVF